MFSKAIHDFMNQTVAGHGDNRVILVDIQVSDKVLRMPRVLRD